MSSTVNNAFSIEPSQSQSTFVISNKNGSVPSLASKQGLLHCTGTAAPPDHVISHRAPDTYRTPHVKPAKPGSQHLVPKGLKFDPLQLSQDGIFHIPRAIQGFGLLVVLELTGTSSSIPVQAVSENSKAIIGRMPSELLSLESFTSIIKETQVDDFIGQIDLIQSGQTDIVTNRFEPFTVSMSTPDNQFRDFWCVMHQTDTHSNSMICEFELHQDERTVECLSHSKIHSPSYMTTSASPHKMSAKTIQLQTRPLRSRNSVERRAYHSVAMGSLQILSRVQDRLAAAPDVESLLEVAVDTVKELIGFHRIMVYQFDQDFNARVVAEHADAEATTGTYKRRTFPASEFTKEHRDSHKSNKIRMLYDRGIDSARLVCRTSRGFQHPINLTHSYLRAMSHDQLKSLEKMAVRSAFSISIGAFDKLWGLIVCHSYGPRGMRVSVPVRRICYLLSDMVTRNIERLSYISQLQATNFVNTLPTSLKSSGCLSTSLEPLLKLLRADFGILSVRNTTQVFGSLYQPQEALVVLAYLRIKTVTSVLTSTNVNRDFMDLRCPFDLRSLGGVLAVPLPNEAKGFIVFFRRPQFQGFDGARNPSDTLGLGGHSEPRKPSQPLCETDDSCQDWTEKELDIASVFAYVYAKLIAIWGPDEAALHCDKLTQILLSNAAHEIRTPLNAVINYLEIALEGSLDKGTRAKLEDSQRTSKSLLHFVHELLKLITGRRLGC